MVRLLKVKELEERKRFLLARSEMYRQTLTLEVANLKFSAALIKRKLKSPKSALIMLGLAVPAIGYFMGFRRSKAKAAATEPGGLLPKVLVGLKLFSRFAPLLKKFGPGAKRQPGDRQNVRQFSR